MCVRARVCLERRKISKRRGLWQNLPQWLLKITSPPISLLKLSFIVLFMSSGWRNLSTPKQATKELVSARSLTLRAQGADGAEVSSWIC